MKNIFFKFLIVTCLITINLRSASATNYYVSNSGNDNNNGTSQATPWSSIGKVNATTLVAGDKVYFNGGQTFNGQLTLYSSGSSSAMIVISSYGTGKASINGGNRSGIYVSNAGYVQINDLIVYGGWNSTSQSGNDGLGIAFYNSLNGATKLGRIEVLNCEIYGFNGGLMVGVGTSDGSASGYAEINIKNNLIHDNAKYGMFLYGTGQGAGSTAYCFPNVYIGFNRVFNNYGVKSYTASHTGNGILVGQASGGIIEHNATYNNGKFNGSTGGGPAGCWAYDCTNLTFQYNESYNNTTNQGGSDGDGFDFDGGVTNCIMQYNYAHDNGGAGILVWEYGAQRVSNSNNIIRYNILQNNSLLVTWYGEICVGGGKCTNNQIYNNTIYNNSSSCIRDGGVNTKYYNNIFYSTRANSPIIVTSTGSSFFLNNNYYNPNGFNVEYNGTKYTSLASFRANRANEYYNNTNYGFNVNPSLDNAGNGGVIGTFYPNTLTNYALKNGSPMINAGINLVSTFGMNVGSKDFNLVSIPRNGAYDIGACGKKITTQIETDQEFENLFSIYPNPSQDGIFNLSQSASWKVTSIFGDELKSGNSNQINLLGYPKGVYLVKVGGKVERVVVE